MWGARHSRRSVRGRLSQAGETGDPFTTRMVVSHAANGHRVQAAFWCWSGGSSQRSDGRYQVQPPFVKLIGKTSGTRAASSISRKFTKSPGRPMA